MTKDVIKETLSASENKHYNIYCGKCGLIKTPIEDMLTRLKKRRTK